MKNNVRVPHRDVTDIQCKINIICQKPCVGKNHQTSCYLNFASKIHKNIANKN